MGPHPTLPSRNRWQCKWREQCCCALAQPGRDPASLWQELIVEIKTWDHQTCSAWLLLHYILETTGLLEGKKKTKALWGLTMGCPILRRLDIHWSDLKLASTINITYGIPRGERMVWRSMAEGKQSGSAVVAQWKRWSHGKCLPEESGRLPTAAEGEICGDLLHVFSTSVG